MAKLPAVAVAHRRGVIHRDIKPRNVLIDEAGAPRLIDFGLARLDDAWRHNRAEIGLSGTVSYMAPEQARAKRRAREAISSPWAGSCTSC